MRPTISRLLPAIVTMALVALALASCGVTPSPIAAPTAPAPVQPSATHPLTAAASTPEPTPEPVSLEQVFALVSQENLFGYLEDLEAIQPYSGWRSSATQGEVEALDYVAATENQPLVYSPALTLAQNPREGISETMLKSKSLWLLAGGVAVGLALLLVLAVILVQVPQGGPDTRTPVATEVAWGTASPLADTVTAHPGMAPLDRLDHPAMSDPPTQIELGHSEYWMSCMVCHGDRGQGLTEEWRSVLDPADMNCWQSKCHAANHPPEGFQIPRTSPLIIGPDALTGYETAEDLFEYLREEMPWPFPGLFQDDQYWQLTAFLLDANEIDLGKPLHDPNKAEICTCEGNCECELVKEPLGPGNGADFLIIPQLVQTHKTAIETEQIVAVVVVGLFLGAAVAYWLLRSL